MNKRKISNIIILLSIIICNLTIINETANPFYKIFRKYLLVISLSVIVYSVILIAASAIINDSLMKRTIMVNIIYTMSNMYSIIKIDVQHLYDLSDNQISTMSIIGYVIIMSGFILSLLNLIKVIKDFKNED